MATEREKMIARIVFGWYEKPDIRDFFPIQEMPSGADVEYPLDLLPIDLNQLSEQREHDKNN